MHCQDCGHTWTGPGYDQETLQSSGCPNCGSFRTQVSPTHSEMAMRDMPGAAASGLDDMGGNPLQEGVWGSIDGGWQNRMKRDESFASIRKRLAEINPYQKDDPWHQVLQDKAKMERDRQFVEGPGASRFGPDETYDPWRNPPRDIDTLQQMQAENPHAFQTLVAQNDWLARLMGFQGTVEPAHSEEWLGQGSGDNAWHPGMQGRGIIDDRGGVHTWPFDSMLHEEYARKNRIQPSVFFDISPKSQVSLLHGDLSPEHQQALTQRGLTYDPNYDRAAEALQGLDEDDLWD